MLFLIRNLSPLFILVFVLVLSACENDTAVDYMNVSPEEAKQLIDNYGVVVLDVRTPEEFQEGHIPNAQLIPVTELENRLQELNEEKSYLVVCRSGNRSAQASNILAKSGFSSIYNMAGGMNSWSYEMEK